MPAIGTLATLAMVFIPMTAAIALPRSQNGKVSATVAFTCGKITALPTPEQLRAATISAKLGTNAATSVARPMTNGPMTRKGLGPIRSDPSTAPR